MALKKMLPPGEHGRTIENRQASTETIVNGLPHIWALMQKNVDGAVT